MYGSHSTIHTHSLYAIHVVCEAPFIHPYFLYDIHSVGGSHSAIHTPCVIHVKCGSLMQLSIHSLSAIPVLCIQLSKQTLSSIHVKCGALIQPSISTQSLSLPYMLYIMPLLAIHTQSLPSMLCVWPHSAIHTHTLSSMLCLWSLSAIHTHSLHHMYFVSGFHSGIHIHSLCHPC